MAMERTVPLTDTHCAFVVTLADELHRFPEVPD